MILIAAFISMTFLYSLVSRRLERTMLTAPILFTALGMLMATSQGALNELAMDRQDLLLVAELGLVMTLFTDASRVPPHLLKGETSLPETISGKILVSSNDSIKNAPLKNVCDWNFRSRMVCSIRPFTSK